MNDPISRQAAIDTLAEMYCKSDEDGYVWIVRSDAWSRIDALPTIGPVKYGRWDKDSIAFYWRCSECGAIVKSNLWDVFLDPFSSHRDLNYCPNCGAEMKGEEDETDT